MIIRLYRVLRLFLKWPGYKVRGNHFSPLNTEIGIRTYLRKTSLGKYTFIGRDCVISNAQIGNYTCIADGVQIGGMEHPYWDLSISPKLSDQYIYGKRTIIGNDVWIAAGCIIKQGVTIGDGAVVGANSFVSKDVPPYAIVFGTPAKIHKYRFDAMFVKEIQESGYWKYPPKKAKAIINELRNLKHE